MNILILGGINEAKWLADSLTSGDSPEHQVIYSIVGKGEVPNLNCPVRVGGFSSNGDDSGISGIEGLTNYLQKEKIDVLIDATHPYAEQISLHAYEASEQAGVELWGYQRPPWVQQEGDSWIHTPDWLHILEYSDFKRPFITLGSSIEPALKLIPRGQHWLVRALPGKLPEGGGYELIGDRGPYSFESEKQLLIDKDIDVLVAKNSGGDAVEAKIEAARELGLAVIMQARPFLPEPERLFLDIKTLRQALE